MSSDKICADCEKTITFLKDQLRNHKGEVYCPVLFLNLMVYVITALYSCSTRDEVSALCKNIVFNAIGSAVSGNRHIVSCQDMFKALVWNEGSVDVSGEFTSGFKGFLQEQLPCINFEHIIYCYRKQWGNNVQWDPVNLKKMILNGTQAEREFQKFAGFVHRNESIYRYRLYDVMAEYLSAYESI